MIDRYMHVSQVTTRSIPQSKNFRGARSHSSAGYMRTGTRDDTYVLVAHEEGTRKSRKSISYEAKVRATRTFATQ